MRRRARRVVLVAVAGAALLAACGDAAPTAVNATAPPTTVPGTTRPRPTTTPLDLGGTEPGSTPSTPSSSVSIPASTSPPTTGPAAAGAKVGRMSCADDVTSEVRQVVGSTEVYPSPIGTQCFVHVGADPETSSTFRVRFAAGATEDDWKAQQRAVGFHAVSVMPFADGVVAHVDKATNEPRVEVFVKGRGILFLAWELPKRRTATENDLAPLLGIGEAFAPLV